MMKKIIFTILLCLTVPAILWGFSFSSEKVEIYGQEVPSETAYLRFSGEEINSVPELCRSLSRFRNLKYADLGNYTVDVADEKELLSAFPGVEFKFDTTAVLYGQKFYTNTEAIDLSAAEITDVSELRDMLPHFKRIKSVTLGANALPEEQRTSVEADFPNVKFEIVAIYDVFGKLVREDAQTLDFHGVTIGKGLSDKLRLFPRLSYVDMHGQGYGITDQLALTKAFPNIKFGWGVNVAGTEVDSMTETMDLNNKYMVGHLDELRRVMPLFHNLKKVEMCDTSLSNEELAALRTEFPDVKIVWRIYMGKWSLKTDVVAFSVLIYTYNYRPMVTADIQVLKYCTDLRALDLGHQAIADISVIGDYLTELRLLILADNMLTDLSPLAKLPHLHYLEFFVNNVTDLTPLASCTQLVDLNISYNHNITDITPLLHLPKLERLWLESTAVPEESVQLLRAAYPNATIINYGKGSIDQGWRTHERYTAMMDMWLNHPYSIGEEFTKYD